MKKNIFTTRWFVLLLLAQVFLLLKVQSQTEDLRFPPWAFKTVAADGSAQTGVGFVDITKPPFNADPTGVVDATEAIQKAINTYLGFTETIYFPEGTYKVSNTLV